MSADPPGTGGDRAARPGREAGEGGAADAAARVEDLARRLYPYHVAYERARDRRAVFAYAYYNLTVDLVERLRRPDHGFDDPAWVADLAVAFGERYAAAQDAIDGWRREHGRPGPRPDPAVREALYDAAPKPWADVYLAVTRPDSLVLEDLVFSMAAHIGYDLPNALLAVGDEGRLADYHRMNGVLANDTDFVQRAVTRRYNRFLARLDGLVGGADEAFTGYGVRVARSLAWYNARRLRDPAAGAAAGSSIRESTAALIASVRRAGPWWLRLPARAGRTLVAARRQWPREHREAPVPDAESVDAPDGVERLRSGPSRW